MIFDARAEGTCLFSRHPLKLNQMVQHAEAHLDAAFAALEASLGAG